MQTKKNLFICMALSLLVLQTDCNDANKPAGADHGRATKKGTAIRDVPIILKT